MFWYVSDLTILSIYVVFRSVVFIFLVSIPIIKLAIYDFMYYIWITWNKWKDKKNPIITDTIRQFTANSFWYTNRAGEHKGWEHINEDECATKCSTLILVRY